MSKIGKLPISIPEKVDFKINDGKVQVKGEKGDLAWTIPKGIEVKVDSDTITVSRKSDAPEVRSLHGLVRSKLANMVKGVSEGFERVLEISGVGFKAEVQDDKMVLNVGLSHPVEVPLIDGVEAKVTKNEIALSGADKETVGEMAAKIRSVSPPEPYKGKGIKYKDEIIKRKAGKAAKAAGA